ncbi:MAG: hypothetical protein GXO43_03060 [Crenarchaeota archaeon]|nr:hypothetical protein [Thermoproteota archaeon]
MERFGLISVFRRRVLEGILIGAGVLSVIVIVVIALCIYVFNMMLSLDIDLPLKIALSFAPIGFATFATSIIMHEILDLGIIANNIVSSEYSIDFFKGHHRRSSMIYCRLNHFSAENSSYHSYCCSQGRSLKNYVGRQRR